MTNDQRVAMKATAIHTYNGKVLRRGEPFIANNESDASELEAIHFAERDMTAPAPKQPTRRGQYSRRDMQAQQQQELVRRDPQARE